MQNVSAVAVPLDPLLASYLLQHEVNRTCQKPKSTFA